MAPMIITKHISRSMIQNKKGTIIFFSSIASILEEIGSSSYASSKSALESFSKIIKNELKNFRINVSVFRILYVSTELSKKLNKKKIINLKKKFKTNKFGTINKIYENIVRIFEDKKYVKHNTFRYFKKAINNMYNILITSVGGTLAPFLIHKIKYGKFKDLKITGTNQSNNCNAKYF